MLNFLACVLDQDITITFYAPEKYASCTHGLPKDGKSGSFHQQVDSIHLLKLPN